VARIATLAVVAVGIAVILPAGPASAGTIHVNCGTQDLQAAITAAPAGSTLLVKGICYGTFTVDHGLTLQGDPTATLDGTDLNVTLRVSSLDPVHLTQLVITGGAGGIVHTHGPGSAGPLFLLRVTVRDNANVLTPGAFTAGGGIFSRGPLHLTRSAVVDNLVRVTDNTQGVEALGGGIYSESPTTLIHSVVRSNRVSALSFATGSDKDAQAEGGGVAVRGASLTVRSSRVEDNHATATAPNGLGIATGGGLWASSVSSSPSITIVDSHVDGNAVHGSGDQATGLGGGFAGFGTTDTISVTRSTFLGNEASALASTMSALVRGGGVDVETVSGFTMTSSHIVGNRVFSRAGAGAVAFAGGLFDVGPASIESSEVSANSVTTHGGTSTAGGGGGGIAWFTATGLLEIATSTVAGNRMTFTSDSSGAGGRGGGVDSSSRMIVVATTLSGNSVSATAGGTSPAEVFGGGMSMSGSGQAIRNSTVAGNAVRATAPGGTAKARGGGIEFAGQSASTVDVTVVRNLVSGSGPTPDVHGGGVDVSSGPVKLRATILALNTSSGTGPDCSGVVGSSGHNLVGKRAGCTFGVAPGDHVPVPHPKLGPLAANGGPTKTVALLLGSPAIDAIPATACPLRVDQRGVHRPQGATNRCDIGAYERKP
jgi:hypothetical protein